MDFDSFAALWMNRRVDYDHVYKYQCVDLILEYLYAVFAIPDGVAGNAIDYWTRPGPVLLAHFDRIQTTDVQKGDIVILNGLPGNSDGHIGIGTGNINGTDVEILEQNGQNGDGDGGNPDQSPSANLTDGNQIRTRYIPKVRIAGVLRSKVAVPAVPQGPPFTVTTIAPKMIELIHDANLWDLNQPTFNEMSAHSNGLYPAHYQELAQAVAAHNDGYSYYMVSPDATTGFNTLDCQDYIAPAPEPVLPPPVVLPSAPKAFPAIAVPFQVTKPILGYMSATAAINHSGATTNVPAAAYYAFKTDPNSAVNITRTVGVPGIWINPADLIEVPIVVPEEPTDWRSTLDTSKAGQYICITNLKDGVNVYDLEGKRPTKKLHFLDVLDVSGFFTFTDGKLYARPKNAPGNYFWYAIAPSNLERYTDWYDKTYDTKTSVAERKVAGTLKPDDYVDLAVATVEKYTRKAMDIFIRRKPK